ncbi:MAG TPA: hypothetical protein VH251_05730 [Verrucomicrobiae bacterium]|jgi:hypothetical protein|nr:hypothetical protein [Verrucomicrobiae bacterium]
MRKQKSENPKRDYLIHVISRPGLLRTIEIAFGHSALRTPHSALCLILLSNVLFLSGCQSPVKSLFDATGPNWHVQQGQALWRPKTGLPEFGGDLVLASDDAGRHLIQFDKTPMAILSAQTTSNRWLIKFPPQNLSFSGFGPGSTRFGWLYLPEALDGKPLPKNFKFERKSDGGWRLENSRTGETLEGFLSP